MTVNEAINVLELHNPFLGTDKNLTEAFDIAIKALTAQQWIPCSERLPEKEGWYITTVESEKTGKRRIENDLFAIDIALAHGHIPNKFCKDGYRQRTVAWCEFPEPWKGEKDGLH